MILAVYRSRFANTLTRSHTYMPAHSHTRKHTSVRVNVEQSKIKKNLNINESTSKKRILQKQQQRKIHNEPGSIYLHLTFVKFKCGY